MRPFSSFQVVLVSLGLFLVACDAFASNEVYALSTFKEAIYEDPFLVLSNWNALDADPCEWSGISCSFAGDFVVKINISGASLKGFLAPELSILTSLQELNLHGNYLIGVIPKEIGMLKNLKLLDLGMNRLSGPIPAELGNLTSIVKINLQSNGLTGRLPAELGNLKYLKELLLDRNKLQGAVPGSNGSDYAPKLQGLYVSSGNPTGFCRSSQLKIADFSYNFLTGSIPKCLGYLPSSSFQGNCLQDGDPKQRPTIQCGNAPPAKSHPGVEVKHRPVEDRSKHEAASKPAWLLALEIVTGVMVGSLFLVALLTTLQKCKKKPSIIIPWKKSASEKDHMAFCIGWAQRYLLICIFNFRSVILNADNIYLVGLPYRYGIVEGCSEIQQTRT
ncbi:unnamed protein product [Ilex paraguariensis]|uniref:Leucine-rich repeat-containing N-terminal plant-type domain-containing protein n=1 Tax=Ilex paraguariensis TaxID=185542 RepID=A0ABC8UU90_9AQUA